MGYKITVPPSAEPITLSEVKSRLSIADAEDDTDITNAGQSAVDTDLA